MRLVQVIITINNIFMSDGRNNNITIYKSEDGKISFNVNVFEETVWLTQRQMGELFGKDQRTISEHINNIFKEGELYENSVYRNFRYTASDGKTYNTKHYNLDVIISVGYRIKSQRGIEFRKWATSILKQYLLNGYAINETRVRAILDEYVTTLKSELKSDFKEDIQKIYDTILEIANRPINIYNQISLTSSKLEEKIVELIDELICESKANKELQLTLQSVEEVIKKPKKDKKEKSRISEFFADLGDENSKLNKQIKGIKKAKDLIPQLIKLWEKFKDML